MDQMKAQWRVLVLVASFKDELFGLSTIQAMGHQRVYSI